MTIKLFCPSIPTFFPSVSRCAAGTTESTHHVITLSHQFQIFCILERSYRKSRTTIEGSSTRAPLPFPPSRHHECTRTKLGTISEGLVSRFRQDVPSSWPRTCPEPHVPWPAPRVARIPVPVLTCLPRRNSPTPEYGTTSPPKLSTPPYLRRTERRPPPWAASRAALPRYSWASTSPCGTRRRTAATTSL